MALRIPQTQITSKYTSGGEYIIESSHESYTGYYYELNGGIFVGKTFNPNAPTLIAVQSDKTNPLLLNLATYAYGRVSGAKVPQNNITSLPTSNQNNLVDSFGENFLRFFCQKTNTNPPLIKEIDEATYISLQNSSLYITTYVGTYNGNKNTIEDANNKIPGLSDFIYS